MNKKILVPIIIVLVLVVVAGVLAMARGEDPAVSSVSSTQDSSSVSSTPTPSVSVAPSTTPTPTLAASPKPTATPSQSEGRFSEEENMGSPDVQVFEVVYNGSEYSPATSTIRVGDIVIFKNNSKGSFQPASSPHPNHTDYPEFDAQKPIAAGQSFQFKFTKAGTWRFHDHLSSHVRGTIVVEQ